MNTSLESSTSQLDSHTARSANTRTPQKQALLNTLALVDLDQNYTTRIIFDTILNQLSNWSSSSGEELVWNTLENKVENWDKRQDGLEVVNEGITIKKRKGIFGADRGGKRIQQDAEAMMDDDENTDAPVGDLEEVGLEHSTQWSLKWSRTTAPSVQEVSFIKDTLDHFYDGLNSIYGLEGELRNAGSTCYKDLKERRWIVFDHGERIHEVASGGSLGGAPKETGLGMTFAASIYRLGELTSLPISTIMISKVEWSKAREGLVGLKDPVIMNFPPLEKADIIRILTSRFSAHIPHSDKMNARTLLELFSSLVSLVYDTFSSLADNDLEELAHLTLKLWPKWLACVESNNPSIAPSDTARLSAQLKSDLAKELDRFALPRLSLSKSATYNDNTNSSLDVNLPSLTLNSGLQGFVGSIPSLPSPSPAAVFNHSHGYVQGDTEVLSSSVSSGSNLKDGILATDSFFGTSSTLHSERLKQPTTPLHRQAQYLSPFSHDPSSQPSSPSKSQALSSDLSLTKSLPLLSKWLLLASFYAGFNPPKSDVRHFVKIDEGIARRGKKIKRSTKGFRPGGSPSKMTTRTELAGSKAFPLERMLSIFEAIVDGEYDYASQSVDVLMQVTTLINLRLLQRVSAKDKAMDGVKLKCKLTRETVDMLAKSIGKGDWTELLWDAER